jgi:hypothetical protein
MCRQTLARWAQTDWPGAPRVHLDPVQETDAPAWGTSARARRLTDCFAMMLRRALEETNHASDWFLFLEDDLEFHPRLAAHVGGWEALEDSSCWLASLFNPSLQARERSLAKDAKEAKGSGEEHLSPSSAWRFSGELILPHPGPLPRERGKGRPAHAFAAEPKSFLGAQALLLRREAARAALDQWDSLAGMTSQRLAKLCGGERPIWVHKPSLVQHVAVDSAWGARVQKALDFDRGWEP